MKTHILTPSRWSAKQIILAAVLVVIAVAFAAAISIGLSPARISFSITGAEVNDLGSKDHPALYYNFTIVVDNRSWHTKVHYAALSIEISYGQTGWVPAEVDTSALPWHWLQPRETKNINASAAYSQYIEAAPAEQPPFSLAGYSQYTEAAPAEQPPFLLAGYSQYTEAAQPTLLTLPPAPTTEPTAETPPSPSLPATTSATTKTPPSPAPDPTTNTTAGQMYNVELIALVWFKFGLATTRAYNVRTSCHPVYFFRNSSAIVYCNP